jgi:single-stranded-DNA-specific exonuclease
MLPPLEKNWKIAPRLPEDVDKALEIYPPILRQVLYNRGFTDLPSAQAFIEADLATIPDPFQMKGIQEAVGRISRAISQNEAIVIYGDYDADGVTATALLVQVLKALGARVQGYIPNRFDEGYGLNKEALEALSHEGISLVITVDCGIRSLDEVSFARSLGLDLIISDHHHPAERLPDALAIINPKQPGDTYPDKNLAGVGLAYKLACALVDGLVAWDVHPEDYLDLVALGTVSDLVPLTGENRILARAGMELIRRPIHQGIMALIGVAGLTPARISSTEIGFALGPRLNAAGRLDSALAALELLTTQDLEQASLLAQQLDNQNRERQKITREIQQQAEKLALSEDPHVLLLFAADPSFNPGVVGLAASRLVESYYRPAIVAFQGDEFTRASCRSITEFHITQALDQCAELMEHHGGHAAAAGFTIRNEKLPALLEKLKAIAAQQLSDVPLRPTLEVDLEVKLWELKAELLRYLDLLQPTGVGNPQATFVSRNLRVLRSRTVGTEKTHLRLTVADERITYDAIAFRHGHWASQMPSRVDLLYNFEMNEYNGQRSLQLNVRDIKPA